MKAPAAFILLAVLGTVVHRQGPAPALPDLIPFQKHSASGDEIWGYADPSGRLVIPAQYEKAKRFAPEGVAEVRRNKQWGLIDKQGREVVPPQLTYHVDIGDGLLGGCVDDGQPIPGLSILGPKPGQQTPVMGSKCGFFDYQGKVAIPFEYDWVHPFREGVAPVSVSRRSDRCRLDAKLYGLIDTKGAVILPFEHCHIGLAQNGLIRVVYENRGLGQDRVGFVDRQGKVVIPKLPYDSVGEDWRGGLMPVGAGGRTGLIDRTGREIAPPKYQGVSGLAGGLIRVTLDGKSGYLDANGQTVIPLQFDDAGDFDDGLACVRIGGRQGFIDRTGKLVVTVRSDPGWSCRWIFSDGLRPAPQGDKWGYINRSGQFAIAPQFDEAWGFTEGRAAVRQGELWGFIDQKGTVVIPPRYFRVDEVFANGLAYVTVRVTDPCCKGMINKWSEGFITRQGKEFFDRP